MTRNGIAIAAALGLAAVLAPLAHPPAPRLLWNATASAPIGLYGVRPARRLAVGDWVAARTPRALAPLFAARGYLPVGAPLVKQVAAVAPRRVCRLGARITLDGATVAEALRADRSGRPLPVWRGCRRLGAGEVFLLNAAPTSLDSRYFGPVTRASVIGRLTPIWTRPGAGR